METVNVSGLKNNPTEALRKSQDDLVVVMNRDRPDAIMVGLASTGALDLAGVRAALAAGWLRTWTGEVPEVALPDFDEGESACIRIALAHQAARGHEALLLIDERAGRAVAQEHQLRMAGTAAVIGTAQMRGLIPSARNVFETLLQSDFRISAEVIRTVLARIESR